MNRYLVALLLFALPSTLQAAESCRRTAGAKRAAEYVRQCRDVSPATHPPCNAANPCELIIAEIRRGCAFLGAGRPAFCKFFENR